VAQGGRYVSASLAERLAAEITTDMDKPLHAALANREYQVLLMLGDGKTVKEIAEALSLSVKTISTYRTRILRKLHLHTTADLIRYVLSEQLLSQPASRMRSYHPTSSSHPYPPPPPGKGSSEDGMNLGSSGAGSST
jgi:DNA-binding CsgD family transcriptional regulator